MNGMAPGAVPALRGQRQGHVAEVARAGRHVDRRVGPKRGRDARRQAGNSQGERVVAAAGVGQLNDVLRRRALAGRGLGGSQGRDDTVRLQVGRGIGLAGHGERPLHGIVPRADKSWDRRSRSPP